MSGKVLLVVTNHGDLGSTGKKTGWYLPEVAHPYEVFTKAGFTVDFLSPKGGLAPMDPGSGEGFKDDPVCSSFLKDAGSRLNTTLSPAQVHPSDYKVIFYAGGHGPMWDLPSNTAVAEICSKIYEHEGIVAAVCHGTVGLLPVKISSGSLLIAGQSVTSFTDAEEDAVGLTSVMPFALETQLKKVGAKFTAAAENFACHTVTSGRIVTGQNPASATATAEAIVKLLHKV